MLPSDDLQQKLAKYNISAQDHRTTFLKDDDKLTVSNIFTVSEGHPFQAKLNAFRERESNITITALAEKNVETILLHEIIMNNFNRDLIQRN